MKEITYKKKFSLSVVVAVISGTAIHRVFNDWQALVRDVGGDGAWIIAILYTSIYGVIISIGAILSAITLRRFKKSLHLLGICAAALISIVILEIYFKMSQAANILDIFAILILSSWFINSALSPDVWLHNKEDAPDQKPVR
jgi:zinc transporter ZupT